MNRTSPVICVVLAFFAGSPVLVNLLGTYVADGASQTITLTGSLAALLLIFTAGLRLGLEKTLDLRLGGPLLLFMIASGSFWFHWLLINVISPSPLPELTKLAFQALLWIVLPGVSFCVWRATIDLDHVIRWMIVLCAIYVVGLFLRWLLGLGYYHSGRWHAGDSLEAIRSGRYAAVALWVFTTALLLPKGVIDTRLRLCCILGIPVASLLMIATNARGPWLSLAIVVAVTMVPTARRLMEFIGRDARLLLWLLLGGFFGGGFLLMQFGAVESNFGRLFSVSEDGGSAAGRIDLWTEHWAILVSQPWSFLTGAGYAHGLYYPHNIFLEALTAGGLPSLIFALLAFGAAAYSWADAPRGDLRRQLFGGIFLLGLIGAQVSGSIGNEMMPWYGAFLLCLASAKQGNERGLS
jgi:O-antigen ligase